MCIRLPKRVDTAISGYSPYAHHASIHMTCTRAFAHLYKHTRVHLHLCADTFTILFGVQSFPTMWYWSRAVIWFLARNMLCDRGTHRMIVFQFVNPRSYTYFRLYAYLPHALHACELIAYDRVCSLALSSPSLLPASLPRFLALLLRHLLPPSLPPSLSPSLANYISWYRCLWNKHSFCVSLCPAIL